MTRYLQFWLSCRETYKMFLGFFPRGKVAGTWTSPLTSI